MLKPLFLIITIILFISYIILIHTINTSNYEYTSNINTKWIVIQYDDRDLTNHSFNKLITTNKEYCKLHGLDYVFINKNYDNYPPYWIKVKIIYDMIHNDKYNKYDGFIWIDSDAVFSNKHKNILSLINNNHSFYISPDPITFYSSLIYGKDLYKKDIKLYEIMIHKFIETINNLFSNNLSLCVGVFMVKNNKVGKELINKWWNKYNPSAWSKKNNKWHTDGIWAGIDYEQGTFNSIIYPIYSNHIKVLHSSVLSDINYNNSNSYVSHYMGNRKEIIDDHY